MSATRTCVRCGKEAVRVRKDGLLWRHWDAGRNETCTADESSLSEPASTVDDMTQKQQTQEQTIVGAASEYRKIYGDDIGKDSFTRPTKPVPQENVSGQPEAERDQWGRYLLPHPVTGEYSDGKQTATRRNGWMRATTFAKLAADTYALTRYDERLTLLGATLRPDVVALAHGKDVRADKGELDKLVMQVKDAAGAKVAANLGTAVHGFTEQADAGAVKTLEEIPAAYQSHVCLYRKTLIEAGLEPVSGLIERTTAVDVAGRLIVGTFDRIYRVSWDTWVKVDGKDVKLNAGDYVIGDLKTGRDLSYGRMEIACQFALYARGVNAHGVFDWNAGQWTPKSTEGIQVRTDVGVVVHLPVQGDYAGTCTLMPVDLELGWSVAELNARVKNARDHKGYFGSWNTQAPVSEPSVAVSVGLPDVSQWAQRAYSVDSGVDAANVWNKAHSQGATEAQLDRLTEIMKGVLSSVDTEPPF